MCSTLERFSMTGFRHVAGVVWGSEEHEHRMEEDLDEPET